MSQKIWRDGYVDVDGIKTHYIEAGTGPTLVLIHGGGTTSCAELSWDSVIEPFSRHLHVVAVDVVGWGYTEAPGPEYFPARAQGDFLVKFIEALALKPFVGGNSHGGWLSYYVALNAPERVQGLVIINSASAVKPWVYPEGKEFTFGAQGLGFDHPYPTRENLQEHFKNATVQGHKLSAERLEKMLDIALRNHEYSRERAKATRATVDIRNQNLSIDGQHLSHYADQLQVPVLMAWSRENAERGASIDDALNFMAPCSDAELHAFQGAGHGLHQELPERFISVVTEWVLAGS